MTNLTANELLIFNNLSRVHNPHISLGGRIQELITGSTGTGTAVNAVAAKETLIISGVVVDSETVSIGANVYEFVTDATKSKTIATNIAVDIAASAGKASGTLTVAVQPIVGDTMWIGTKIYTFVADGTANAEGEVSVGTDLASAKLAIVAAINGTDTFNNPSIEVSASAFVADVCTLTALVGGVIGNAIPTTETFDNIGNVFGAGTLATGTNCTAANAKIAFIAAVTASDTQGVGATSAAGTNVLLTADVAGILGNNIALADTMANGAFTAAAIKLSGGINGTVGLAGSTMVDATYLYTAIADNGVADANWRRIAVGAVY